MGRSNIQISVLKRLYAHSGNKCAFENCNLPIFEDDGVLTGECAHIKAYSAGGKRYDNTQTNSERNGYDNLILLCSRHHTIIDKCDDFSVDKLLDIKHKHEGKHKHEIFEATLKMLAEIKLRCNLHYKTLEHQNNCSNTYKIKIDANAPIFDVYQNLYEQVEFLLEKANWLGISESETYSDLESLFDQLDIDKNILNKIPYCENPFFNRGWEVINIAVPNSGNTIKLELLHLKVKIFELLLEKAPEDNICQTNFSAAIKELEEYHKILFFHD